MTGLPNIKGLNFSGAIEGVKISPSLLANGEFPITEIGSMGVAVTGNLFGGEIDARLLGGILKLDEDFNIITDGREPAQRVLYVGVQGGFSFAGIGGLTIRFALSELGPLEVFINVEIPGGILLEPITGLTINDFAASVEFFKTLPSVDDPKDLRGPEFELPANRAVAEWDRSVRQQVAQQARVLSENPNRSGFRAAFTSPMLIKGQARLYSMHTSQAVFNGQVSLFISTDGKFMVGGKLNFLRDNISVSGKLYADLSNVEQGDVGRFVLGGYSRSSGAADT